MAKASSPKLRFLCARCRTRITVSMDKANRFVQCPSCQQKTPVPSGQQEADDDARDLGVQSMAYQVGENCIKCGRKMKKGAVVCVKCGFDYKEGRQLTTDDYTVQEGEKRRGGPALKMMVFEFFVLVILAGAMIFRLLDGGTIWWEHGLYLTGMLWAIFNIPGHFYQWYSYRSIPVRDHPLVKEEDRAEREEAMSPYDSYTVLVFIAAVLIGMGSMCFTYSRDKEGKFVIPFMSDEQGGGAVGGK